MGDAKSSTNRLVTLRKREAALKAAIAAEQVRQQKHRERDRSRLAAAIGIAVLEEAAHVPDFELLIKQTLKRTVKDDKVARFLAEMKWL